MGRLPEAGLRLSGSQDTGEIISYGLHALDGKVKHPYNLHLGQGALAQLILEELPTLPTRGSCGHTKSPCVEQDETVSTVHVAYGGR